MNEWSNVTTLGELAQFTNGYAFKPSDFTPTGLPVVRIHQLLDANADVDRFDGQIGDGHRIQSGDLVMSWSGTIAVVVWKRGKAWLNQHLFRVDPRDGVSGNFLRHLLLFSLTALRSAAHGSTMVHITRRELARFPVSVPPSTEQRRIAEILDVFDAVIGITERLISKYEMIRTGAASDLLSVVQARTRSRDSAQIGEQLSIAALDETCLDGIDNAVYGGVRQTRSHPRSGSNRWASLGELIALEYGATLDREARSGVGIPVYGSNGVIGLHHTARVEGPGIVVGRKGSAGSVQWSDRSFWPIDTTYWVRPLQELNLRWLFEVLKMCGLESLRTQTGVPGLNREDVYERIVCVPSQQEQQRIVDVLSSVDDVIQAHECQCAKLRRIQTGLAADLLSGRVRTVAA